MSWVIETNELSKSYGKVQAVNAVSLRVGQGDIYGFIGLNGAGKTTTIRALLGMIRPSAGSAKVLGATVGANGRGLWRRIGHLVEAPTAYPELTVRENLDIARRLQGVGNPSATSRVIEQLSLTTYADRKAGTLSTGNLQRLGLARALLHEPELLILDEPANGLDPAGVVEIRELLVKLTRENGVTVFISSHVLAEVHLLATRIGIIHEGKLIEELESDELERLRSQRLEVEVHDQAAAQRTLSEAGFSVNSSGHTLLLEETRAIDAPDIVATILVNAGTPPIRLAVEQENLEDHFLKLTGTRA